MEAELVVNTIKESDDVCSKFSCHCLGANYSFCLEPLATSLALYLYMDPS